MNAPTVEQLSLAFDRMRPHIQRANAFAAEHFERFPNLKTISLNIGALFVVNLNLTLTWERPTP